MEPFFSIDSEKKIMQQLNGYINNNISFLSRQTLLRFFSSNFFFKVEDLKQEFSLFNKYQIELIDIIKWLYFILILYLIFYKN